MEKFLKENGYKKWNTESDSLGITCHYQKRMVVGVDFDKSVPLCNCNEKLLMNIRHYKYTLQNGEKVSGCEIYLVHENKSEDWCDIKIYALSEEKLKENLVKYEKQLIAMWEAFSKIG